MIHQTFYSQPLVPGRITDILQVACYVEPVRKPGALTPVYAYARKGTPTVTNQRSTNLSR